MATARLRLPESLDNLTRDELTEAITQACLGQEDTKIAMWYLIDHRLHMDISVDLALDRSTVSRRLSKIIPKVTNTAKKLNKYT